MATLPSYDGFETTDGLNSYKQWEHGIITAEQCREKLRQYGESLTDDEYAAMCREEADANAYHAEWSEEVEKRQGGAGYSFGVWR